jgi:hypothetical protein
MTITADTIQAEPETATDRLVAKLRAASMGEPVTFTAAQAVYLMGAAAQWARDVVDGEPSKLSYRAGYEAGYRARVAEENAAYPPPPYDLAPSARSNTIAVHRSRSGVDVVEPREGDFQGLGMEAVEALRSADVGAATTWGDE